MRPVILYRDIDFNTAEFEAAKKYFTVTNTRTSIQKDDLVIGRYSVLPFYREQERDVRLLGARLINSHEQHLYIADLRNWYEDLYRATPFGERLTPRTWMTSEELMRDTSYDGPYVVKGITNSKKHSWKTHMFAESKVHAIEVASRLMEDSLIGQQAIVFREYVPLKRYDVAVNGMPIGYEWRFIFAYGELLCGAWYWSSYIREDVPPPSIDRVPLSFLGEVNNRIFQKTNFVVVDVAETEKGEFLVVELNDGQMSGLSENAPDEMYQNLHRVLKQKGY